MDEKRLQEIKGRAYHEASTTEELGWKLNTDKMFDDMKQLIAALEEAQAELTEVQNDATYHATLANSATGELSDAQVELADLRKQLVEALAEVVGLNNQLKVRTELAIKIKEELIATQAENERLRNMRGFTPDAASDK